MPAKKQKGSDSKLQVQRPVKNGPPVKPETGMVGLNQLSQWPTRSPKEQNHINGITTQQ